MNMEERPETELISIPGDAACVDAGDTDSVSPIGTPMKRVLVNMKGYLEEVVIDEAQSTDAWLPITESRNGNAHYAAFHTLECWVGFQALLLPVAFRFSWLVYMILPLFFTVI
ncbi:hypothetical protein LWI28_015254 [Acer negundo]|uniref:Uncharacterized protein n=1 Tax=Acer negundo TaxID=4023 RepID=A0AAD5JT12_ACENE|nr:hypothetical protein LWI28_015254 [Acer negundo]